jgi:hypothetical protein
MAKIVGVRAEDAKLDFAASALGAIAPIAWTQKPHDEKKVRRTLDPLDQTLFPHCFLN